MKKEKEIRLNAKEGKKNPEKNRANWDIFQNEK